jgi:hypothetical protein
MSDRERKIRDEARRLWTATRSGPPPALSGSDLLDLIVRGGEAAEYERLHSPHLRPGMVMGGRPRR